MQYTTEEIAKSISESFKSNAAYSARKKIWEYYDPENAAFEKIMLRKNWRATLRILQSLEESDFLSYYSMFPLMTVQALVHFLPAFMIVSLAPNADKFRDFLADMLIPDPNGHNSPWFIHLLKLLDSEQKKSVAMFVCWMFGDDTKTCQFWSAW